MRSQVIGESTSSVEILNISQQGLWLLVDEREYFLPFADFPWFRDARIIEIFNVQRPHANHLYWPLLDVDLMLDSLALPEKYPLIYQ